MELTLTVVLFCYISGGPYLNGFANYLILGVLYVSRYVSAVSTV